MSDPTSLSELMRPFMGEQPKDQAKLQQAAAVLNSYGKRTSKPEPGQTWRVRVPRSARCDGQYVERDGVVQQYDVAFLKKWFKLEVLGRVRYVHIDNMLYLVASTRTEPNEAA